MSWRREGSKTYVTAVICVEWFVTGSWARSVCTYHVICELPAKVAAAFTQPMVDHIYDHLSQLVRSGPQVIHGPPAGCFDLCAGVGVCATCSQVFHSSDSFSSINRTIQLQKSHRKWFQNGLFLIDAVSNSQISTLTAIIVLEKTDRRQTDGKKMKKFCSRGDMTENNRETLT